MTKTHLSWRVTIHFTVFFGGWWWWQGNKNQLVSCVLCIENFEEISHFLCNDIQNAVLIKTRGIAAGIYRIPFLAAKSVMVTLEQGVLEDAELMGCKDVFGTRESICHLLQKEQAWRTVRYVWRLEQTEQVMSQDHRGRQGKSGRAGGQEKRLGWICRRQETLGAGEEGWAVSFVLRELSLPALVSGVKGGCEGHPADDCRSSEQKTAVSQGVSQTLRCGGGSSGTVCHDIVGETAASMYRLEASPVVPSHEECHLPNTWSGLYTRGWHTCSIKGRAVHLLSLGDCEVPMTRTQCSLSNMKAALDNMQMSGSGCVPIKQGEVGFGPWAIMSWRLFSHHWTTWKMSWPPGLRWPSMCPWTHASRHFAAASIPLLFWAVHWNNVIVLSVYFWLKNLLLLCKMLMLAFQYMLSHMKLWVKLLCLPITFFLSLNSFVHVWCLDEWSMAKRMDFGVAGPGFGS